MTFFLILFVGIIPLAAVLTPIIVKLITWNIKRDIDRKYREGWYD